MSVSLIDLKALHALLADICDGSHIEAAVLSNIDGTILASHCSESFGNPGCRREAADDLAGDADGIKDVKTLHAPALPSESLESLASSIASLTGLACASLTALVRQREGKEGLETEVDENGRRGQESSKTSREGSRSKASSGVRSKETTSLVWLTFNVLSPEHSGPDVPATRVVLTTQIHSCILNLVISAQSQARHPVVRRRARTLARALLAIV